MKILLPVLVLLISFPAYAETPLPDLEAVRGFVWQLPKEIIKENEKGTYVGEEGDVLFFLDEIDGRRTTIGYEFEDNKLWRAKFFIEKQYYKQHDRIEDLMTIQSELTQRFGDPVAEDLLWLNNKEKNFPYSWGWAVYRGELIMTSVWRNPETEVVTYLGAEEKFNPVFSVTYEHIPTKLKLDENQGRGELLLP